MMEETRLLRSRHKDRENVEIKNEPYKQILKIERKPVYEFTKRIMDIVLSFVGLVSLSWLFAVIAIIIKLEDRKGPVFFSQIRNGKDGEEFKMYKFRSMVTDAEEKLNELLKHNELSGHMFKMSDDPRVTRIGKFIRKTSIDELPQLLNVLKGDMSLIGPRPPLPREVEHYSEYQMQRLKVKPGCSGLWQATARNDVGFKEMVELDLKYIQKRGVVLDVKIIIKTLLKILKKENS